ncbi:hypothetical protein [Ahrensia sp. R2A130]|uniref:hypothetical protein n=1 Tax=Ahrensia sp. R2A130 TaxID=744979 RepID=UPI0001E0D873|nr:hypothetical protein [Ahrensia sp. R2A130]EFL88899.1 lipoprotein [Ahrensia sp. R2A130]
MPLFDKMQTPITTAALAAMLALTACQTGSVLSGQNTDDATDTAQDTARQNNLTNPNDRPKLANTRTALTDYCPTVQIRAGTESFRILPKGEDPETSDKVRYQVSITNAARECNYVGQNLQMRVGVKGRLITGPVGGPGTVTMPIRIAVTEGNETIYSKLYKQPETISSGESAKLFSFVDEEVIIPAPTRPNIRVYIGFDEGPYNTP